MFSTNQRFVISGDNEQTLRSALQCALKLKDSKVEGYSFDPNIGMVFHSRIPKDSNNITAIPAEEIGNFDYLFHTVLQYLSSQKYKNQLHQTLNLGEVHDGSSHEGWEIGSYTELHAGYGWDKFLYIKPFWTFYSK